MTYKNRYEEGEVVEFKGQKLIAVKYLAYPICSKCDIRNSPSQCTQEGTPSCSNNIWLTPHNYLIHRLTK